MKDGLIMQVGTLLELYETPDNVFVAQFIDSPKMNLIDCVDTAGFTAAPCIKSGAVQLGIRPEHVTVTDAGTAHCDGVVQVSEFLRAESIAAFVGSAKSAYLLGMIVPRHFL